MKKFISLSLGLIISLSSLFATPVIADTFVPCDTWDTLCMLDCDLDSGEPCGTWIRDPEPDNCPANMIMHDSGNCIYANDAACRAAFGDAYYDGNGTDGCTCMEGAIFNGSVCELPDNCPSNMVQHANGNCVYKDDNACRAAFGEAYYDGNGTDGCTCLEGAVWNGTVCEFPTDCPEGMKLHENGTCIYEDDAACRTRFGQAYYNGNGTDGCTCLEGAIYDGFVCEFPDECPENMMKHSISENCIYKDDAACRAALGEAYFDGNEVDGCACLEGALWDGEYCVAENIININVNTEQFNISADGEAQQKIEAYLTNQNGERIEQEIWVKLQTTNPVKAGSLEIISGQEGSGSNSVEAVYKSPLINNKEKLEQNDVLEDYIYVFTMVNGEKKYKVITASLITQAEAKGAKLSFEKPGFEPYVYETTLDKGSLSGKVFLNNEGNALAVDELKVSLEITNADGETSTYNTMTDIGDFSFQDFGIESPENFDMGEVKLELNERAKHLIDKGKSYSDKIKQRISKYGGEDPSAKYLDYLNKFTKYISDSSYEKSQETVDKLELSSYSLYFIEYYSQKADESLSNFTEYMINILKDTLGFAQGFINLTSGVFDAADEVKTPLGKMIAKYSLPADGDLASLSTAKNMVRSVLHSLRSGIESDNKLLSNSMGHLSNLIGGLEATLFGEGLNAIQNYNKDTLASIDAYLKGLYLKDLNTIVGNSSFNIEGDMKANIAKAEATFKSNTEKHNYRNEMQYEWDVDTSAINEFLNVLAPAIKMGVAAYTLNPITTTKVSEIVDKSMHAFNALKVAASSNHTYEWYSLYREDLNDLSSSLSALSGGGYVSYNPVYEAHTANIANLDSRIGVTEAEVEFVEVAKAEVEAATVSSIMLNIAQAVEDEDLESLEANLKELEIVRGALAENQNVASAEFEEFLNNSEAQGLSAVLAADNSISNFTFESDQINLALLNLSFDQSPENLALFREQVSNFGEQEYAVQEKIQTAEAAMQDNPASNPASGGGLGFLYFILFMLAIAVFIEYKKGAYKDWKK